MKEVLITRLSVICAAVHVVFERLSTVAKITLDPDFGAKVSLDASIVRVTHLVRVHMPRTMFEVLVSFACVESHGKFKCGIKTQRAESSTRNSRVVGHCLGCFLLRSTELDENGATQSGAG